MKGIFELTLQIVFNYLAMTESWRLARHGCNVQKDERVTLVIQFRVCSDRSRHRINRKISVRVSRINRVANAVRTCAARNANQTIIIYIQLSVCSVRLSTRATQRIITIHGSELNSNSYSEQQKRK